MDCMEDTRTEGIQGFGMQDFGTQDYGRQEHQDEQVQKQDGNMEAEQGESQRMQPVEVEVEGKEPEVVLSIQEWMFVDPLKVEVEEHNSLQEGMQYEVGDQEPRKVEWDTHMKDQVVYRPHEVLADVRSAHI